MSLSQVCCCVLSVLLVFSTGCAVKTEARAQSTVTIVASPSSTGLFTPDFTPMPLPQRHPITVTPIATQNTTPQLTLTAQASPVSTQTKQPTPTITSTPKVQSPVAHVPILMYHYISVPPMNADRYRKDLSVTPDEFEAQLRFLAENGYTVITLYDLYANLSNGVPLSPKSVVLTFDDGYRDAYQYAFPLLLKYKMRGTFFVVTGFIDNQLAAYLTWEMVKEMSDAGMRIESHSRSHPDMHNRSFEDLVWQILGPIESITAYTGHRPHFFCYPSGQYDDAVIRVLRSVDTWGAVTTHVGYQHSLDDAMTWTRVRIHGTTRIRDFASLLK